jgi:PKD repeat protein
MFRFQKRTSILGVLALSLLGCAKGNPVASLAASRLSGPAPLAVFFDATGTKHTDPGVDTFRELGYRFEFGDPASGIWTQSGLPKNEQIGGPLAAHVFETAGEYVVKVTARSSSGASDSHSVTISVRSADEEFPGRSTVCVSTSRDFTDCPDDARRVSRAKSWPEIRSDTRYLLRAGQDFTELGPLEAGNIRNVQIGSFGAGAKPIVGRVRLQADNPMRNGWVGDWMERVTVMDLDVEDIVHYNVGVDMLFLRNDLVRGGLIEFSTTMQYYLDESRSFKGWRNPENVFFVENNIDRTLAPDENSDPMGISGQGRRFAVMGNRLERTVEHNLRIWQVSQGFIAHNYFDGIARDFIRLCVKIHSQGTDPVVLGDYGDASGIRQMSSEIVLANNHCGGPQSNLQWLFAIGPQNEESGEGVEKVIVEDSTFEAGTRHVADVVFFGRDMTDRGNENLTYARQAKTSSHENEALSSDWDGPYYLRQPSVRELFADERKTHD